MPSKKRSKTRKKKSIKLRKLSQSPRRRYGFRSVCLEPYENNCVPCTDSDKKKKCFDLYSTYKKSNESDDYLSELIQRMEYMNECTNGCLDYGHVKRLYVLLSLIPHDNELTEQVNILSEQYDENGIELFDALLDIYAGDINKLLEILNQFNVELPEYYTYQDRVKYYSLFRNGLTKVYKLLLTIPEPSEQLIDTYRLMFKYKNAMNTLPEELVSNIYKLYESLPVESQYYISHILYGEIKPEETASDPEEEYKEIEEIIQEMDNLAVDEVELEVKDDYLIVDEYIKQYEKQRALIDLVNHYINEIESFIDYSDDLAKYKIKGRIYDMPYLFNNFSDSINLLSKMGVDILYQYIYMVSAIKRLLTDINKTDRKRLENQVVKVSNKFKIFIKRLFSLMPITLYIYYYNEYGIEANEQMHDLRKAIVLFPGNDPNFRTKMLPFLSSGKLYVTDVLMFMTSKQFPYNNLEGIIQTGQVLYTFKDSIKIPEDPLYFQKRADKIAQKFINS